MPNVITTSDAGTGIGYTGIRVRGSDATRVNVTINGIPYNDAESMGTYWVDLPDFSSSVENLQLQRGVGTSTNGAGAFGASINLLTDAITENAFAQINTSFGSYNTQKYNLIIFPFPFFRALTDMLDCAYGSKFNIKYSLRFPIKVVTRHGKTICFINFRI